MDTSLGRNATLPKRPIKLYKSEKISHLISRVDASEGLFLRKRGWPQLAHESLKKFLCEQIQI